MRQPASPRIALTTVPSETRSRRRWELSVRPETRGPHAMINTVGVKARLISEHLLKNKHKFRRSSRIDSSQERQESGSFAYPCISSKKNLAMRLLCPFLSVLFTLSQPLIAILFSCQMIGSNCHEGCFREILDSYLCFVRHCRTRCHLCM